MNATTHQVNPNKSETSKGLLSQSTNRSSLDSKLSDQFKISNQKKLKGLQNMLRVGSVNDRYEQEADRVANQVVATPVKSIAENSTPKIQQYTRHQGQQSGAFNTSVAKVISGNGMPLASTVRQDMEQRFGHDFSKVRIHCNTKAELSARQLNAHAYTVGSDIVFGNGKAAFETSKGQRLLAHELTHCVQQRSGNGGLCIQRDVIDDVEDNLSYGIVDWAITDSEAMESLALLGTIAPVNLAKELGKLESKYVTRLLDNLPDAAKSGDVYERVITTLGAKGVEGYVTDQLSYGVFDWAITDAEVTRVFNTFVNLPAPEQEKFLAGLKTSGQLDRLIDNANTGHHALYIRPWINSLTPSALNKQQRSLLLVMVKNTPDSEIETLKVLLETRFDVIVGKTIQTDLPPVDWDAASMRTVYLVLDKLPDAHVAKNKELLRLGQFKEASRKVGKSTLITAGQYSPSDQEFAINSEASGDNSDTIRHEVAHAVDLEMGWSKGAEPAKHSRGGWKTYGIKYKDCVTEMVDDSNAGIKSDITAPQRVDVISEMAKAMGNRSVSTLEPDIRNLPWFAGLNNAKKTSVIADKAIDAIGVGLAKPWFNAKDGGEQLGNHVYQESYTPTWVRYRHEARSRFISNYQFRDEGEWFAEAYDLYYTPDSRGRGAKLNDIDSNTKTYFDTNVHTRAASR